jgi:hypothetical protein
MMGEIPWTNFTSANLKPDIIYAIDIATQSIAAIVAFQTRL